MSREIKLLQILSWLCMANGIAFTLLELYFGQYINSLYASFAIIPGLGVYLFVKANKTSAAFNFFRIGLLIVFYIFDTGFFTNTGSYLFYVPFIIVTFLFESPKYTQSKI